MTFDKLHITKDEINELPMGAYEGEVIVIENVKEVKPAVKEINKHRLIGFDTETKPAFKKGVQNPVSLVQLAIPSKVFLFRLNKMGFPNDLINIFASPRKQLVGLALRDDVKDLQKITDFDATGFIELSDITRELGIVNAGARGLAGLFLDIRISKSQQTSNWEIDMLSEKQIRYAATDAWICLEIYQKLIKGGHINGQH